jgi:hypothetical protein
MGRSRQLGRRPKDCQASHAELTGAAEAGAWATRLKSTATPGGSRQPTAEFAEFRELASGPPHGRPQQRWVWTGWNEVADGHQYDSKSGGDGGRRNSSGQRISTAPQALDGLEGCRL